MASLPRRLMGIETEYGIHIDGLGPDALVKASRELVESHPKPYASPWEYRHEHPRRDARGFVVDRLSVDPSSPYHDGELLARGVGVRFKGEDKTNVEEYCVSEGWVRVTAGNAKDRHGNPLTIKVHGTVEPYFRDKA